MTSVSRWNPFEELATAWPRFPFGRELLARLRPGGEFAFEWNPRCDVTETDTEVVVHAELPGVSAGDMDVSLSGSQLRIRGEKRSEKAEEKEGRKYQERFFGSFERVLTLPEGVDADKISASLKDGVLEVRVPRAAPATAPGKKIEIKAG
jgi:HSP20 family protein